MNVVLKSADGISCWENPRVKVILLTPGNVQPQQNKHGDSKFRTFLVRKGIPFFLLLDGELFVFDDVLYKRLSDL